jgi:hypothetical protein
MALLKDSGMLTQIAFVTLSAGMSTTQFAHLTAYDFFWGYEDQLFSLATSYNPFAKKLPYTKFGILVKVLTVIAKLVRSSGMLMLCRMLLKFRRSLLPSLGKQIDVTEE